MKYILIIKNKQLILRKYFLAFKTKQKERNNTYILIPSDCKFSNILNFYSVL